MVSSFRDLENFDHPECKPEIKNFWRLNYVRKFDNVLESNVLELLNDRRLREEFIHSNISCIQSVLLPENELSQ